MPKDYNLKELIPITLKNKGPLRKNEIRKYIIKTEDDINQISDKTLNENIFTLLKNDKIEIADYKFKNGETKRLQHIKSECLIFDVVRDDPVEIRALINQLDSEDSEIVEKANKKLKKLFRINLNQNKVKIF